MVLPFIGAGIATGIGTLAGLSVGPYLFKFIKPASYRVLSEETDHDLKIAAPPHGLNVQSDMREALPLLEPWLTDPGYHRVSMINRLTTTVWPTITKAILDLVITGDVYNTVLYPQLKAQVFDKYPFVEDIFLGPHSLKRGKPNLEEWLTDKEFHLGKVAPRMGGFKVVPTADDEVLLETSASWGSKAQFDVSAVLKFGPVRLIIPLRVSNISFKADIRVLLRPLIETFPCLGGVSVSLLNVPHVDCCLELVKGVDLMALPVLPQLIRAAMKLVLEPVTLPILNKPLVPGVGVVLPNSMSFPIATNFGLPPPPPGAIKLEILSLEGIRGGDDLYVRCEVRRGRYKQTKTIDNNRNPHFNEEFALMVDSFENDTLRITVYNDDLGWNDTPLSEVVVPFGEVVGVKLDKATGKEVTDFKKADFIVSCQPTLMKLPLQKIQKKGLMALGTKARSSFSKSQANMSRDPSVAKLTKPPKEHSSMRSTLKRLFTFSKSKKALAAAAAADEAPPAAELAGRSSRYSTGPAWEDPKDNVGSVIFKLTFIPFNEPKFDDEEREKSIAAKVKDPRINMFPPPIGRAMNAVGAGTALRGVLTVTLIRCVDLAPEGAKDLATYVRMLVANDEKDEEQESSTILNETSPRWGDKFDFVLIPAASSELHIEVFNKTGAFGNLMGAIFRKSKDEKDTSMGRLVIKVEDVARNGRLKDTWALQDAERGYIELNLQWQTCYVSEH